MRTPSAICLKHIGLIEGFDPRSAQMNYYFRRGRFPEFLEVHARCSGDQLRQSHISGCA